jgi:HK97 family phage prohead protease
MKERRYTPGAIEVRSEDGGMTIVGHASMFDEPYELSGFREQVARGAFKKSMKEGDVAALWNHDPNVVLGRNKSGTLRLTEDDAGLRYEVDLPDTQAARDLYTLIQRGDIYQSSFAFEIQREKWDKSEEENGLPLRTIKQVRLFDVSPVTYPASPTTDVDIARAMRSMTEAFCEEATTEAQADAQPETAPVATPPQEPKRTFHPYV